MEQKTLCYENLFDLLNEFLDVLSELYDGTVNLAEAILSAECTALVAKIEKAFVEHGYDALEKEFGYFVKSMENGDVLEFSGVEEEIGRFRAELEKIAYRGAYNFDDGVLSSSKEDLDVGSQWSSKSKVPPGIVSTTSPHGYGKTGREVITETEESSRPYVNITLDTTIEELALSVKEFNFLKRRGVLNVLDIFRLESDDCRRSLDGVNFGKVIAILRDRGADTDRLRRDYIEMKTADAIKPRELTLDSPIEFLELSDRAYCPVRREGVKTVRDVFKFVDGTSYCRSLGRSGVEEIVTKLKNNGFLTQKFCAFCNTALSEDDLKRGNTMCANCHESVKRTSKAGDIVLEVLPPEESTYSGGTEKGFHLYVNVKNNTGKPVRLGLKECTIFKNGRQNNSNYNLIGYTFNDEYIFPTIVKTFSKIWITDKWKDKHIGYHDYLTICLKNLDSGEVYYYKFNYSAEEENWWFTDYYKMDK